MSNCDSCPSKGNCGKDQTTCGIVNNPHNKIKHVIGVMSGKGGVGKSSMSVLLAKQLQKEGYKVGVLDADITGPSIPRLFGLENVKAMGDGTYIYPVVSSDGIKTMSLNYLIEDESKPVIWRGPIIANAVKQFWNDVLWGELDFLFIDMPPGTGDVALTVMQTIPLEGVVMVSIPQDMVSMIVSKAVHMAEEMDIKVLGIIENMSYIICPDCNKQIKLYDAESTETFLKEMNVPLLGELPMTSMIGNIHKDDTYDLREQMELSKYAKPMCDKLLSVINE